MQPERKKTHARFHFLKGTPLHPQWFAHRDESRLFAQIGVIAKGMALDIGCSDQRVRHFLSKDARYLGFDYPETASQWYGTRPEVFGDAHCLPFANATIDTVMLLDVLEHLKSPDVCIREIHRVLKTGGTLILKVPFIYPIHDAPRDFHRWTQFGLAQLVQRSGLSVKRTAHLGNPLHTAALVTNIAWSKTVLNWISARSPLALVGLLLPIAVLTVNVLSFIFGALSRSDEIMPHGYFWVLEKFPADKAPDAVGIPGHQGMIGA